MAGAKAAWIARRELTRDGQIALLTTAASSGQDEIVRERLTGFQEVWATHADNAAHYPIMVVPVDADGSLSKTLSNPKLALIVAFDVEAAELAIKATASRPESERIPIVTLDTSEIVLDAIEDGRVSSAVFNDVYEDGYEAVRRLAMYSREDEAGLPTPGCGTFPRNGEIVSRSNVADVRGKMAIPVKEVSGAPQLHLSSAEVNASLLTP